MAFEWNNECMEIPTIMNGFAAENRVLNCFAGIADPHSLVGYIKIYDFPATQAFLSRPINRHTTLFSSNNVHVQHGAWTLRSTPIMYTELIRWRRSKHTHSCDETNQTQLLAKFFHSIEMNGDLLLESIRN